MKLFGWGRNRQDREPAKSYSTKRESRNDIIGPPATDRPPKEGSLLCAGLSTGLNTDQKLAPHSKSNCTFICEESCQISKLHGLLHNEREPTRDSTVDAATENWEERLQETIRFVFSHEQQGLLAIGTFALDQLTGSRNSLDQVTPEVTVKFYEPVAAGQQRKTVAELATIQEGDENEFMKASKVAAEKLDAAKVAEHLEAGGPKEDRMPATSDRPSLCHNPMKVSPLPSYPENFSDTIHDDSKETSRPTGLTCGLFASRSPSSKSSYSRSILLDKVGSAELTESMQTNQKSSSAGTTTTMGKLRMLWQATPESIPRESNEKKTSTSNFRKKFRSRALKLFKCSKRNQVTGAHPRDDDGHGRAMKPQSSPHSLACEQNGRLRDVMQKSTASDELVRSPCKLPHKGRKGIDCVQRERSRSACKTKCEHGQWIKTDSEYVVLEM